MPILETIAARILGDTASGVLRSRRRLRLRPDHSTLYSGWYTQRYAGRKHFYVVVACAPSRRFRRPRALSSREVRAFLDDLFPNGFTGPPAQLLKNVVAFEEGEASATATMMDPVRAVRVWASGLVEFLIRVPHETGEEGPKTLNLLEVLAPVRALSQAVSGGGYKRLFGLHTRWRRLDWFVAVGNAIEGERGWQPWDDLSFPGRRPLVRAIHATPAAPSRGLGSDELQSLAQRTNPERIIRAVLLDLVRESGWDDGVDEAIEDAIESLKIDSGKGREAHRLILRHHVPPRR